MTDRFSYVKRGYDPEEADAYIETLERELKGYKEKDNSIKNAILNAQIAADSIILNAKNESRLIRENALVHVEEIRNSITMQRALLNEFHREYTQMIDKYLHKVRSDDFSAVINKINELESFFDKFASSDPSNKSELIRPMRKQTMKDQSVDYSSRPLRKYSDIEQNVERPARKHADMNPAAESLDRKYSDISPSAESLNRKYPDYDPVLEKSLRKPVLAQEPNMDTKPDTSMDLNLEPEKSAHKADYRIDPDYIPRKTDFDLDKPLRDPNEDSASKLDIPLEQIRSPRKQEQDAQLTADLPLELENLYKKSTSLASEWELALKMEDDEAISIEEKNALMN